MKKRFLAWILAFLMLTACLPVSIVAAGTDAAVSFSTAKGAPGETVTVTVTIENNPGIVSMYLNLEYDQTRLRLVSATDAELLNGAVFGQTVDSYPYALTWDDSVAAENNTGNGTLVTLEFLIKEDAPLGDATIKLVNSAGIINFDFAPVEFTLNEGKITVAETSAVSEIIEAQMELGTDVTMYYYASVASAHEGAEMIFTLNGKETRMTGEATETEGVYRYAFRQIAPQCMDDTISAKLVLGDEVLDTYESFSVRAYCDQVASMSATELGISETKKDKLNTLAADLLAYGARAQVYRGYKTDSLANAGFAVSASTFTALNDDDYGKYIEETDYDGLQFTGAGVYYSNAAAIYLYFTMPRDSEDTFALRVINLDTDDEIVYEQSDLLALENDGSTYLLVCDPVSALNFDTWYSFELCTYNARGRLVTEQYIEYKINSYVHSMQGQIDKDGNPTAMALLAQATYNYGAAARAYAAET